MHCESSKTLAQTCDTKRISYDCNFLAQVRIVATNVNLPREKELLIAVLQTFCFVYKHVIVFFLFCFSCYIFGNSCCWRGSPRPLPATRVVKNATTETVKSHDYKQQQNGCNVESLVGFLGRFIHYNQDELKFKDTVKLKMASYNPGTKGKIKISSTSKTKKIIGLNSKFKCRRAQIPFSAWLPAAFVFKFIL
jgi:hypothetical protein